MKARRQSLNPINYQPSLGSQNPLGPQVESKNFDDIIAIRKVNHGHAEQQESPFEPISRPVKNSSNPNENEEAQLPVEKKGQPNH